jgi:hypothetical protein
MLVFSFGGISWLREGAKRMWGRTRFSSGKIGRMGIVAGHAVLLRLRAHVSIPVTAHPAMGAGIPIAVGRAVTTAAERSALGQFQFAAIARLQEFQIIFVVAIVTEIVPVIPAVPHDDVGMLRRDDEVVFFIEGEGGRFALLVADVAIEIRDIGAGADEFRVGGPGGGGADDGGIGRRDRRQRSGLAPQIQGEPGGQGEKEKEQTGQDDGGFMIGFHPVCFAS